MNDQFKSHLLEARSILVLELQNIKSKIDAIDQLLGGEMISLRVYMAKNGERRKGGVKHVLEAVKSLGHGTIRQITNKVQVLFPIENEIGLHSKVATYLKRLNADGDIEVDESCRPKIYKIK